MSIATLVESKLCVADMEDFETQTGVKLLDALEGVKGDSLPETTILTGLIWIAKRHEDPAFTYEQARYVPITELVVDERANPPRAARRAKTGAAKKAAPKKRVSKR